MATIDISAGAVPLSVGVLGPVVARVGEDFSAPPTRQVGRLLATLSGWPGQAVDRDAIVQALWGESPPQTVRNTLQVHVSHLRRWLGQDVVHHRDGGYVLNVSPDGVDVYRFTALVQSAASKRRAADLPGAIEDAQAAVNLVRGPAFPDVRDPDLVARRSRVGELADQIRQDLVEWRLEAAQDPYDVAESVASARELVARFPLRERGYALLMRALFASGRTAEALVVFDTASTVLLDGHGLEPGPELQEIRRRCVENDVELLPPALRS